MACTPKPGGSVAPQQLTGCCELITTDSWKSETAVSLKVQFLSFLYNQRRRREAFHFKGLPFEGEDSLRCYLATFSTGVSPLTSCNKVDPGARLSTSGSAADATQRKHTADVSHQRGGDIYGGGICCGATAGVEVHKHGGERVTAGVRF